MKKINLVLAGVIFSAFAFTFTSCNKDDEDATTAANGSATITGIVRADLNVPQTGLETVPAGTIIRATINTGDLHVNGSGSQKVYSTTTDANGSYTLNVDANQKNVTVTILGDDFVAQQIVPDPANGANATKQERAIFEIQNTANVTVVNGQTQIVDLVYTRTN